jgi:DnaK suppressor protein
VALTRSQIAELEQLLAKLAKEAQDNIRKTMPKPADEKSLDRAGTALDSGDEAVNSVQEEFDHVLHERYLAELQQLEAAQARAASGEIDHCADCGGEINVKRLLAYPLAARCIDCQERYEKMIRGAAAPKL